MTTRIVFESITVREVRNLAALEMAPSSRINVVSGDNGQGKTSLLEAIYLVATSRSFRTERPAEMLRDRAETASVRVTVTEQGIRREQRAVLARALRTVTIDGKAPDSLAAYAMRTPVVVFHPGDLAILSGPASRRRTLLDRVALFVDPGSADHRARYKRAARARARVLDDEGGSAAALGPLERLMAVHGVALGEARARAASRLVEALSPAVARVAAPGLAFEAHFVPGGALDASEAEADLVLSRDRDRARGSALRGPHKDDLAVLLDGRSVRRHASQGQQRILTLALKLAELECVRAARGADPVLLLDDVSSELDPERTGAVYDFLHDTEGQVFVTTTRPELFSMPGISPSDRADFRIAGGVLSAVRRTSGARATGAIDPAEK